MPTAEVTLEKEVLIGEEVFLPAPGVRVSGVAPYSGVATVDGVVQPSAAFNVDYDIEEIVVKNNYPVPWPKGAILQVSWEDAVAGEGSGGGAIADFVPGKEYAVNDLMISWGNIYVCVTANSDLLFNDWNWIPITQKNAGGYLNYYVMATGSDETGDGSYRNPWASIGKVASHIRYFNPVNMYITIYVGEGTFIGGSFLFAGSGYNRDQCYIGISGAGAGLTFIEPYGAGKPCLYFKGIEGAVHHVTLNVKDGSAIKLYESECAVYHFSVDASTMPHAGIFHAERRSLLVFDGGQTITQGGMVSSAPLIRLRDRSEFIWKTGMGLTDPPNTYPLFLDMDHYSTLTPAGSGATGTMIGKKFSITRMSQLDGGVDVTWLPGDVAGTWDTTSYYNGVVGTTLFVMDAERLAEYDARYQMEEAFDGKVVRETGVKV